MREEKEILDEIDDLLRVKNEIYIKICVSQNLCFYTQDRNSK